MKKVKQVTVIAKPGIAIYNPGEYGIAEIKDESIEWDTHIDFIINMYDKDGKCIKSLVNCPMDITYEI